MTPPLMAAPPSGGTRSVLVYMGHPAHFHLLKHPVAELEAQGHSVHVVIKSKDVLERLLEGAGFSYHNLHPEPRRGGRAGAARSLLRRELRFLRLVRHLRPSLMLGTSAEIAHVGRLLRIPSVYLGEDDVHVVRTFARICFPFVTTILAPDACDMGRWSGKTIHYPGYHKLSYLHPKRFVPDRSRVAAVLGDGANFLVRVVELTAHHDAGIRGFTPEILRAVVARLAGRGRVHLSAEGALPPDMERYRARIDPADVHHLMAYCELVVGDGQSMVVEAAMLGTPSIRFSDFVGRIGVLDELESVYRLTRGVPISGAGRLPDLIDEVLAEAAGGAEWPRRRDEMLADKIDVAGFIAWFVSEYPRSVTLSRTDPDLFSRFR